MTTSTIHRTTATPSEEHPVFFERENINIAVLIPSYNEEVGIGDVISGFRQTLPSAEIYVYDNNSIDHTVEIANQHGATVRQEPRQGKGYVVRRMFADIESDIYVLVDGDNTYDPQIASTLVELLIHNGLDMINCARVPTTATAYRPGHQFGNHLLTGIVRLIFGDNFKDMLSGYRVFSRRFVKSFPAMTTGFEIETELTIHALQLEMPAMEVPCHFQNRIEGSESKLKTFSDGFRILKTIANLVRQEKPIAVFSGVSLLLAFSALIFSYPMVTMYLATDIAPRISMAILSTGLILGAGLSMACGFILDTVTRGRHETKRLAYLSISGIHEKLK